jgi:transcriptional regulator with XRE-family HTH domain
MHVSKINILLAALGITHQQIADDTGMSQSMVTMTIKGERTSRKTQDRIASYLREQLTVETLFGIEPTAAASPDQGSQRSKRKRADLSY